MTASSATMVGQVAVPHRDGSADHAGNWLGGTCVSSLGVRCFIRMFWLMVEQS